MVFIIGCSIPRSDDAFLTIDIEKAFENASDILLSDLAEEVEYISFLLIFHLTKTDRLYLVAYSQKNILNMISTVVWFEKSNIQMKSN